jgi:hypothetical protein
MKNGCADQEPLFADSPPDLRNGRMGILLMN